MFALKLNECRQSIEILTNKFIRKWKGNQSYQIHPFRLFFDDYAEALLSLSAEKISAFYQTPLAIYSDENTQTVTEEAEVLAFWKEGIKPYKAQNIHKAIPTVLSEDQLSETIFTGKVRWNNYDKSGEEVSTETNFYILSQHSNELKISGLIIMTK